MDYALGQWTSLQVFLNDGRVEIDNNICNTASGINEIMPRLILCRATN
jgi:hypothetical protein